MLPAPFKLFNLALHVACDRHAGRIFTPWLSRQPIDSPFACCPAPAGIFMMLLYLGTATGIDTPQYGSWITRIRICSSGFQGACSSRASLLDALNAAQHGAMGER
jgi:hypothetical protein